MGVQQFTKNLAKASLVVEGNQCTCYEVQKHCICAAYRPVNTLAERVRPV